jgi:oligopeptide/dipeptide ABC transporter ATP-binding protein
MLAGRGIARVSSQGDDLILKVEDVHVTFPVGGGWLRRSPDRVHAVSGVSFDLSKQETLALVGESGSGKTTVARTVAGLQQADSGVADIRGTKIDLRSRRRPAEVRRRVQMVFQDPYGSLDPRMRIGDQVAEPLAIARAGSRRERPGRVQGLLSAVGLPAEVAGRYPHQLSGGQRQRAALARSIILEPDIVICDEPVSALDVSIQAQVINLLRDLQDRLGLSFLLISHDLGVVHSIAHRVAIMYLGRIVESGPTRAVFGSPRHPYTQALISAVRVPRPSVERTRQRIILQGEIPSASAPPSGCRFRTRCPYAIERCAEEQPQLRHVNGSATLVACHRAEDVEVAVAARKQGQVARGGPIPHTGAADPLVVDDRVDVSSDRPDGERVG